jgi:hypothetical protein
MINSFPQACKKLKLDPLKCLPKVSGMPKRHQLAAIALAKLTIIAEAMNEGWVPDWNNSSEWKYYPWFYLNSPGFRFYGSHYSFANASAGSGSRLCFRTRESSDHAGKKFLSLWRDLMTLPVPAKKKKK